MVVYHAIKLGCVCCYFFFPPSLLFSLWINIQQNENFLKVITWLQFKAFIKITVPFGKGLALRGRSHHHRRADSRCSASQGRSPGGVLLQPFLILFFLLALLSVLSSCFLGVYLHLTHFVCPHGAAGVWRRPCVSWQLHAASWIDFLPPQSYGVSSAVQMIPCVVQLSCLQVLQCSWGSAPLQARGGRGRAVSLNPTLVKRRNQAGGSASTSHHGRTLFHP